MATDIEFGSYEHMNPKVFPYNDPSFSGTWITIEARELKNITGMVTDEKGGLEVGTEIISSWRFLAPQSIQENVVHEWAPWETMASRMAGIGKEFPQIMNDIRGIGGALTDMVKGNGVGAAFSSLSSIAKSPHKVDTPLVYENSQRMEWTMTFNLIAVEEPGDGNDQIMVPIRRLQELSSPTRNTSGITGIDIKWPHVFSVRSETEDNQYDGSDYDTGPGMIDIKHTALTSIQPTYMAPYDVFGYPTRAELTLTFKQLPPLYSDSFDYL